MPAKRPGNVSIARQVQTPDNGRSRFGFFALPGPAPWQAPQSLRREDDGEDPGHADREERPDEEEAAGGLGDLAVICPPHVHDGHGCRQQPETWKGPSHRLRDGVKARSGSDGIEHAS